MKSFREFCEEVSHKNGTYVALYLKQSSAKQLINWLKEKGLTSIEDPKELHTTIVYSRVGIPDAKSVKIKLPVTAKIVGWEIFPTQTGGKCLVARVGPQKQFQSFFDSYYKEFPEATYDFASYKPHITVDTDHKGTEVPTDIPEFELVYDKHKFEGLKN